MAFREAKFCMDLDQIRWTLLDGVITRKRKDDGPTEGQEVSVHQVTGVEKTSVTRVRRSRLARPATLFGAGLLALAGIIAAISWMAATLAAVLGAATLFWGLKRIQAKKEVLDAYRLIIPGTDPNEWVMVGSIPEIAGFVEAIKIELQEKGKQNRQTLPI
ncbi:MAG: hypothetical protein HY648_06130 [Acidobacteria bacterium]|nr:hypothetical protein [Acidobacteriota bacterium]